MWQDERKRHLNASLHRIWVGDRHIGIV
jgi:hypothetical protein